MHREWLSIIGNQFEARAVMRLLPCANIREVGESVEKLSADQVKVAVGIEVCKVRTWPAVDINR